MKLPSSKHKATDHLEVFETTEQSRLEMIVSRFEEVTFWGQKQLLSSMMCPTQRAQALNDDSYINVRLTKQDTAETGV